ncbi:F-box/kelch-repeat protein At3g23880-like [Trifolium pratense]|uniref:F-box/kelch-repeat protein At3g23880-like n=1 Tax=Trifolium pratense TaxID=57577 RepID=UPI001E6972BD|nr:F-box/kelch-repeat protein At3g23880-like [Trifolium pratense]
MSSGETCYAIECYFRLNKLLDIWTCVVGSCNGLLCLIGSSTPRDHWLCFWNPAMRTKSKNFTIFFDSFPDSCLFNFSFGYDNLTRTYKVVAFFVEVGKHPRCVVKVFSLGDNSWRDIQCFPVLPLYWSHHDTNNGVHLNGTINWIALRDYVVNSNITNITVDQCVILSLDLSTETYTQLLLPRRFDKVSCYRPKVVVLMGCLCFCHDFEKTHFIIWQMKNFGVQDSWIQLFKISYENCFGWSNLLPLYLSKNGDTLILAHDECNEAFIYNCRDNRVEKIEITNGEIWSTTKDYFESFVSTH